MKPILKTAITFTLKNIFPEIDEKTISIGSGLLCIAIYSNPPPIAPSAKPFLPLNQLLVSSLITELLLVGFIIDEFSELYFMISVSFSI